MLVVHYSGILRDKTMDDKLIDIPNDDKQISPSFDTVALNQLIKI